MSKVYRPWEFGDLGPFKSHVMAVNGCNGGLT